MSPTLPSMRESLQANPDAGNSVLSPEELADRIEPTDARISPDGTRVVFVADPVGRKGEKPTRTLWIAEAGGPARKLTAGTHSDSDPRWSPDGTRILFRSDRLTTEEGARRLFLLPMRGGEAQPLDEWAGALFQPTWSPDGEMVAVLCRDPDPEAVKAKRKDRDDALVVEEDPRYARLWLVDVQTGRRRCLTTGNREVRSYAWLPDGSGLVTVTTEDAEYDAVFGPGDAWYVPVSGGMPRHIGRFPMTPGSTVIVETRIGPVAAFRADGGRSDPADSLWTIPVAGGEPKRLIPDAVGAVEEVVPLPGWPGCVAARIVARTHGRLFAVDALSGRLTPITPPALAERGSVVAGVSFADDGKHVAAIWTDAETPEEVYLGSIAGDCGPVTSFGASFLERLQPSEHVTWTSDGGIEIEGLLTYPRGYQAGQRYPLFVQIHGGPAWQWEDRVMLNWHDWAQMLASRGYLVLLPNPRGSTAYGNAFQQLLQDDVGGGESRDLIAGAQAIVDRGLADPERLAIGGWSWGGYLTAWTITQTTMFRAAVMGAGVANMLSDHAQGDVPSMNLQLFPGQPYDHPEIYWQASPIRHVAKVRTPTLILHGDEDSRVHPAQGMEYFRALKVLGVPVRFVRYPREGHGIDERAHQIDLMERILDWLERYG